MILQGHPQLLTWVEKTLDLRRPAGIAHVDKTDRDLDLDLDQELGQSIG
jgi:hypothetical protein